MDKELTLNLSELRAANAARMTSPELYRSCAEWNEADWALSLCGEVGELANMIKKVRRGDISVDDPAIGEELADVLVYLDILSYYLGFDLSLETIAKFNKTSDKVGSEEKLLGHFVEKEQDQ